MNPRLPFAALLRLSAFLIVLLFMTGCGLFSKSNSEEQPNEAPDPRPPEVLEDKEENLGKVVVEYESLANDMAHIEMNLHETQRFTLTIDPLDKAGDEDAETLYGSWKSNGEKIRLIFDKGVNADLFQGSREVEQMSYHQFVMPYEAESIWIYGIKCVIDKPE